MTRGAFAPGAPGRARPGRGAAALAYGPRRGVGSLNAARQLVDAPAEVQDQRIVEHLGLEARQTAQGQVELEHARPPAKAPNQLHEIRRQRPIADQVEKQTLWLDGRQDGATSGDLLA